MGSESGGESEAEDATRILSDHASDPTALEGPSTRPDRDDAAHWVAVYQELIGVCRQILDGVLGPGSALPVEAYDRGRLEARLRDFEARQQFWLELLRGSAPPSE